MKGLITFKQMKDLQAGIKYLCENDGIYNQVDHLCRPDDNEVFEYVFNYLETRIEHVLEGWKAIKEKLEQIKNEQNTNTN